MEQFSPLLLFGGMGLIMYFFMIRPQQQKAKQEDLFIEEVKKGDLVVTKGGLYGRVVAVKDTTVDLDIGSGKVTYAKVSLSKELSELRTNKDA